jgi:hypothetical protein
VSPWDASVHWPEAWVHTQGSGRGAMVLDACGAAGIGIRQDVKADIIADHE